MSQSQIIKNFHYHEVASIDRLLDLKQSQNIRISVCLPTLNEEKTLPALLKMLRDQFQQKVSLIDELIVVDSGSTDQTESLTKAAGIPFYPAKDILPEHGHFVGKGENLWKSLAVTSGDIVVFLDADNQEAHPRFLLGLIGPMLQNPEIQYIKGYYQRPIQSDIPSPSTMGGGRLTEILIRPLFSLFYPELSQFNQPLSGEYAAKREILNNLTFPTAYGVETAHLIDYYEQYGLDGLAQCHLDVREHHARSNEELGKAAFEILQVIFKRLQLRHSDGSDLVLPTLLRQFSTNSHEFFPLIDHLPLVERPAMSVINLSPNPPV